MLILFFLSGKRDTGLSGKKDTGLDWVYRSVDGIWNFKYWTVNSFSFILTRRPIHLKERQTLEETTPLCQDPQCESDLQQHLSASCLAAKHVYELLKELQRHKGWGHAGRIWVGLVNAPSWGLVHIPGRDATGWENPKQWLVANTNNCWGFGTRFLGKHCWKWTCSPRLPTMATSNWGDLCQEKGWKGLLDHLVILQEWAFHAFSELRAVKRERQAHRV